MTALRRLLLRHRALAALVLGVALLMKVAVPSGFMLGSESGSITVQICNGYGPATMTIAVPGMEHHQDKSGHQGKEMPCAFSGLAAPALTGADPLLLALVVALIMAVAGWIEIVFVTQTPAFLRPPLRGPPVRS